MFTKQCVVTLDLEGVLAPEIWIAVAEKTGIKDLRLTTRDIPDYDVLMKGRIKILERENIKLSDIQNVMNAKTSSSLTSRTLSQTSDSSTAPVTLWTRSATKPK